jgi:NADH-quinone oxidoreductase subunit L
VLGITEHLEVTAFNPMIAGLSVGIALLGIALGYLVYGLHPVKSGQRDPLSRVPVLWSVFRNKYWMDELYGIVIAQKEGPAGRTGTVDSVRVQPGLLLYFVGWLSDVCFAFDKWVVDGLVNLAGALGRVFSTISGWIDKTFVDGAVNFVGMITNELGDGLKYIQTGRVQNYLLIAITGATVIVFVFFLIR